MTENKLPFKTWAYEEQTKMKHKVFSDYFDNFKQPPIILIPKDWAVMTCGS